MNTLNYFVAISGYDEFRDNHCSESKCFRYGAESKIGHEIDRIIREEFKDDSLFAVQQVEMTVYFPMDLFNGSDIMHIETNADVSIEDEVEYNGKACFQASFSCSKDGLGTSSFFK